MHKIQPDQKVRILTIEIAVPADADPAMVSDELSALLSENGTANPESAVLDWHLLRERSAQAGPDPEEGEIFRQGQNIPNIAVVMQDGLVQCIVSDKCDQLPPMNLMLIDYDTDGADKSNLADVPQGDGTVAEACIRGEIIEKAEIDLSAVDRAINSEEA